MLTDKHSVLLEGERLNAERRMSTGVAEECSRKGHQQTTLHGLDPAGAFTGLAEDGHHPSSW